MTERRTSGMFSRFRKPVREERRKQRRRRREQRAEAARERKAASIEAEGTRHGGIAGKHDWGAD